MGSSKHAQRPMLVVMLPVRLGAMHSFSLHQHHTIPTTLILLIDKGSELQRNCVTRVCCLGHSTLSISLKYMGWTFLLLDSAQTTSMTISLTIARNPISPFSSDTVYLQGELESHVKGSVS